MSLGADAASLLSTAWLGRAWRHLPQCGSTNDEAATWARRGAPHGAVVTADAQERGRGRLGRKWHSPAGESLYFSTVLRLPLPPMEVPPITLAAGVAVAEALASAEVTPALKWPNDLLLDGKKVAGVLTEMATSGGRVEHVIVGIGVNLNAREFPDELSAIATSIAHARGREVDRAAFAAQVCERLEVQVERFLTGGAPAVVDGWKRFARFFGRRLKVRSGHEELEGVAEDLQPDGALALRLDSGALARVIAGEILTQS